MLFYEKKFETKVVLYQFSHKKWAIQNLFGSDKKDSDQCQNLVQCIQRFDIGILSKFCLKTNYIS